MRAGPILLTVLILATTLARPVDAQSYRIMVREIEGNVYQASASKVIIETRVCSDLGLGEEPEEAILNWEGRYGHNWLLFTASGTKCDVVTIR